MKLTSSNKSFNILLVVIFSFHFLGAQDMGKRISLQRKNFVGLGGPSIVYRGWTSWSFQLIGLAYERSIHKRMSLSSDIYLFFPGFGQTGGGVMGLGYKYYFAQKDSVLNKGWYAGIECSGFYTHYESNLIAYYGTITRDTRILSCNFLLGKQYVFKNNMFFDLCFIAGAPLYGEYIAKASLGGNPVYTEHLKPFSYASLFNAGIAFKVGYCF